MAYLKRVELITLFFIAFLAGSFVPLGSEAYLLFLQNKGISNELLILFATLGNTLGGLSCYAIARYGGIPLMKKYLKQSDEKIELWQKRLSGKSEWTAFFCWLPLVGELIAAVLGLISKRTLRISFYMLVGKALRYLFLLGLMEKLRTVF